MTGPEHYREAEALLASASQNFLRGEDSSSALAAAQVHATLALAAGFVFNFVPATDADRRGWADAVSTPDDDYDVSKSFG